MISIGVLSQCCRGDGPQQVVMLLLMTLTLGLWQAIRWTKSTWNDEGITRMHRIGKIALIVVLASTLAVLTGTQLRANAASHPTSQPTTTQAANLPRLVDLGAKMCIPCKKMAPILESLKKDYADRLSVEFIDVNLRENAAAVERYGIERIPTQIFIDTDGRELWRHEGFFSRDEILSKWKELGIDLSTPLTTTCASSTQPVSSQPTTQNTSSTAAASPAVER